MPHHLSIAQPSDSINLLPDLQSAYQTNPSMETAMLRVLANIFLAVDTNVFALLMLLDLSATFGTVDHKMLLEQLRMSHGLCSIDRSSHA